MSEQISPTTQEMQAQLDKLKSDFSNYQKEFHKLESICDAFEVQNKSLVERLSIFESVAKNAKILVNAGDYEALKKLLEAVKI